jgi:hypothetical protein
MRNVSKELAVAVCSKAAEVVAYGESTSVESDAFPPPVQRHNSLKDTAAELERPKELVFELPEDRGLGIRFVQSAETGSHSIVTFVQPGGVMSAWNASCPPGKEVDCGAHLLEVNGVSGSAQELHEELVRSRGHQVKLLMRIGHRYNDKIRTALEEVYKHADEDQSGVLSLGEFNACITLVALQLGQELDEDGVEAADEDGSGYLDFQEFLTYSFALCERCQQSPDFLLGMFRRVIAEIEHLRNPEAGTAPRLAPSQSRMEAALLESYGGEVDDDGDDSED